MADIANSETIVRQTWERYRANNGGSVLTAIDQTLQTHYNTNIANEFPRFTWHNYFLNDGTYTRPVAVYHDVNNPNTWFSGPEWQLFRSHLREGRDNWQAGKAGVLVAQIDQYPRSGRLPNYSAEVEKLGAGYVEFLPRNTNQPLAPGTVLSVTISIGLPAPIAAANARVSVLPITNFMGPGLPSNQFLTPRSMGGAGAYYSFQVANFDQCNRVTVIANVLGGDRMSFRDYTAQLVWPLPPTTTPLPPCFLQLQ